MKNCEAFAELLDPFVDGELPAEDCAAVREHLNLCPECRAYVADALSIRAVFPDPEDTVVPGGFAQSVLDRLPPRTSAPKARPWKRTLLPLAACFAVVVSVGLFSAQKREAAMAQTAAPAVTETYSAIADTDSSPEERPAPANEEAPAAQEAKSLPETEAATPEAPPPAGKSAKQADQNPEAAPEEQNSADAQTPAAASILPEKDVSSQTPVPYALEDRALPPELTLSAAEADLFSALTPVQETETEKVYRLSAQEYAALQEALLQRQVTPLVQTGEFEHAHTVTVRVLR